jgi:AraC-like DNA-binding protein
MDMDYYLIGFDRVPILAYAHTFKTSKYQWFLPRRKGFMQITFVEQGDVVKTYQDGSAKYFKAPCYMLNMHDRDVTLSGDGYQSHYTAGFFLDYEIISVSQRKPFAPVCETHHEPGARLHMVLPEYIEINRHNENLKDAFFKLIKSYEVPTPWRDAKCAAIIMKIMAKTSALNMKGGDSNKEPSAARYYKKAVEYIGNHINGRITVDEIAAGVGISPGYLSRLFKKVSQRTIVAYINGMKIDRIRELMETEGYNLREAGEKMGITDENYLSRMFKKYTGLSVREFKALKRYI